MNYFEAVATATSSLQEANCLNMQINLRLTQAEGILEPNLRLDTLNQVRKDIERWTEEVGTVKGAADLVYGAGEYQTACAFIAYADQHLSLIARVQETWSQQFRTARESRLAILPSPVRVRQLS